MDAAQRLASRVARAARRSGAARTLLLDLDGTLAPIVATPDAAAVPGRTLAAIRRLVSGNWTVAIVSGRPRRELRRLVAVRGVRLFGSHGLEGSWTGPSRVRLEPSLRRKLSRLVAGARRLAATTPGVLIERKPAGLAIHDRLVAQRARPAWNRRLRDWLDTNDHEGFELLTGLRVVELRPEGVHKGRVVEARPRGRATLRDDSLVAIGDDRTDEDLFRALGASGLSVVVGRPGKRSIARCRLPSPAAVGRFLERLARDAA